MPVVETYAWPKYVFYEQFTVEVQRGKYMLRANDDTYLDRPARSSWRGRGRAVSRKWWEWGGHRRKVQHVQAFQESKLEQLSLMGVHLDSLAGRLRLVLTTGCYSDFRFTRDILSTGAAHSRVEQAIEVLIDLGAHCDCSVFQALGQQPRGVLWHHAPLHGSG